MKRCFWILLFLVSCKAATPLLATTYYVDNASSFTSCASGGTSATYSIANRNCSGSDGTAYTTFASGIAALSAPGDRLSVRTGTFTTIVVHADNLTGNSSNRIIIAPYGWSSGVTGETVTIAPATDLGTVLSMNNSSWVTIGSFIFDCTALTGSTCVQLAQADHILLDGIEVKNTGRVNGGFFTTDAVHGTNGFADGANNTNTTNSEIRNCSIHDNGNGGYDHGMYVGEETWIIDHCTVHDNSGYGIHKIGGSNYTVRNNTVYSNGRGTAEGDPNGRGPGIYLSGGTGHLIYNNVVYNNDSQGISCDNGAICEIDNNTVYGNAVTNMNGGIYSLASTVTCRNNLIIGNVGPATFGCMTSANNLATGTAASHFVNAGIGNFHLVLGSSAIGAGSNLAPLAATDKDGVTRTVPWDVGAYAFITSTPPNTPPLEDFTYTTSATLAGQSGGTNWTGPWADHGCGGSFTVQTAPAGSFSGGNAARSTVVGNACVIRPFTAVATGSVVWQMFSTVTTSNYHQVSLVDDAQNVSANVAMNSDGHLHACTDYPGDIDLGTYNANQWYLIEANFDATAHPFNVRYRVNEGAYTAWGLFCVQAAAASLVNRMVIGDATDIAHSFYADTIGAKSTALNFSSEPPATVTSGMAFSTTVDVVYSDGVTRHASATDMISIAICTGSPAATLTGTTNLAATAGAATFNLTLTQPAGAVGVTLCATASNLVGDESIPITIPNAITPVTAVPALVRARIRAR
jgi:parallel beta-helix repeat protein